MQTKGIKKIQIIVPCKAKVIEEHENTKVQQKSSFSLTVLSKMFGMTKPLEQNRLKLFVCIRFTNSYTLMSTVGSSISTKHRD